MAPFSLVPSAPYDVHHRPVTSWLRGSELTNVNIASLCAVIGIKALARYTIHKGVRASRPKDRRSRRRAEPRRGGRAITRCADRALRADALPSPAYDRAYRS